MASHFGRGGIGRPRVASDRRVTTVATTTEESINEVSGSSIANAIAIFLPLIRALILEAEASGKSGPEKQAAVAEAAEGMYKIAQDSGSIKELKYVPWVLIAPFVVPAAGGVVSIIVKMMNTLWGKVWGFISKYVAKDE